MSKNIKGVLGEKLGMTQVWDENNRVVPVTVVKAGPCVVTQVRTNDSDGYESVQIAFGEIDPRKVNKPLKGHFAKADVTPRRHLVELRTPDASEYTLGQEVTAEVFESGVKVDVTGKSKGKGFAGVMKRHNFKGLGAGHGVQRKHRSPGSIGGCATPGRVFKGMRMAGRMGNERVTTQNLTIHAVDAEKGLLLIKGAVPGPNGGLVLVRTAAKGLEVMSTIDILSPAGDKAGTVELPAEIFDAKTSVPLIHQVVVAQLAAARQGTHKTKRRGEVRGGGRKPYRQKGTGRARQGSTRAPQFVGGGVVHGPQPRDYSQRTPKKMKAAALRGALSDRARHSRIHVVTGVVEGAAVSTKAAKSLFGKISERKNVLLVVDRNDEAAWLSARNLPQVHILDPGQLNTYDVIVSDDVVFTQAAFESFVSGPQTAETEGSDA